MEGHPKHFSSHIQWIWKRKKVSHDCQGSTVVNLAVARIASKKKRERKKGRSEFHVLPKIAENWIDGLTNEWGIRFLAAKYWCVHVGAMPEYNAMRKKLREINFRSLFVSNDKWCAGIDLAAHVQEVYLACAIPNGVSVPSTLNPNLAKWILCTNMNLVFQLICLRLCLQFPVASNVHVRRITSPTMTAN